MSEYLTYQDGLFLWKGPFETKDIPKQAGFSWHNPIHCRRQGFDRCGACKAQVGKVWWTRKEACAARIKKHADKATRMALAAHLSTVAASKASVAIANFPKPEGLDYKPYQKAGISFAMSRPNTLMADEMGLGKTIQTLGAINIDPKIEQVLVLVPASLRINWLREAERWLVRDFSYYVMEKTIPPPITANFVIASYTNLTGRGGKRVREALSIRKWDLLVADEVAHHLKNPKSQRAKAVLGYYDKKEKNVVEGIIHRAKRVFFLTGTPIKNRPIDFQPLLGALAPKEFGYFLSFAKRYCAAYQKWIPGRASPVWDFSGASNLEELQERARGTVMIRRLKKDVLTELPAKVRQVLCLPPHNGAGVAVRKEQKAFAKHEEHLADLKAAVNLAHASGDEEGYLAAVRALQQGSQLAFTEMAAHRHKVALAKVPAVINHLDGMRESGIEKILVFAHHKDVIARIADHFGDSCVTLTGSTPMRKRQENVDRFQTDETCKIFLGNMQAAGVGLTLTAASYVVFAELDWVPSNITQAEDRCLAKDSLVFCLLSGYSGEMSLVPIQHIEPGDIVLTHLGNKKRVLNVKTRNHRGAITKIKYVGWYEPLTCTHDHKIFVKRDGKTQWVQAHQLLPSDSMAFPKEYPNTRLDSVKILDKWRVYKKGKESKPCIEPGCEEAKIEARGMCRIHYRSLLKSPNRPPKPPQINPRYVRLPDEIIIDDEWLYLLGWYAAEGFSSITPGKGKFASFSGHRKERPILEKIAAKLATLGIKSSIFDSKKAKSSELRAYSTELALWLHDWFGHLAQNKRLPLEILNLPSEQASVFLRGYTDGDGYYRENQVEWVSASKTLSYQMCLLAIRSGYIPTFRRVNAKNGNQHWVGGYTKNSTCSDRRQDQDTSYVYRSIRKVETTYKRDLPVYDIEVKDDHSFTCGLATVHNCHRLGQENTVFVQHLVYDGSIDSKMAQTVVEKQNIADQALDLCTEVDIDCPVVPKALKGGRPSKYPQASEEEKSAAGTAMQMLAGVCDGACALDGAGFNKFDTQIGHSLAEASACGPLSDGQVWLSKRLTQKYRRQLPEALRDSLGVSEAFKKSA